MLIIKIAWSETKTLQSDQDEKEIFENSVSTAPVGCVRLVLHSKTCYVLRISRYDCCKAMEKKLRAAWLLSIANIS